ncbi:MAG TPA: methyl-accepting chemotaxis protein [Bdellovibrionota bacterium]|nr:methyl-accepting chemotaxis protein [Bdellovibrionota bacterium]
MNFSNWSLKKKLITLFLVVGMTPFAVSTVVSYWKSSEVTKGLSNEIAKLIGEGKADEVLAYLDDKVGALLDISDLPVVEQSIVEMSKAMKSYPTKGAAEERVRLKAFYKRSVEPAYAKENPGKSFPTDVYIDNLSDTTVAMQYDFVVMNDNPTEKNSMELAARPSAYNELHKDFQRKLNRFAQNRHLYDLMLVDTEGNIVLSVAKDVDFGANLTRGPLADSNTGRLFNAARKLKEGSVYFEDYGNYLASNDMPMLFVGIPVYARKEFVGVLIAQIPTTNISEIVSERDGLEEKGQTLVVGKDGSLRVNAFRDPEHYSVNNSFKGEKLVKLSTPAVLAAQKGETGIMEQDSYDGLKTVTYFQPIKFHNLEWYLTTELSYEETFAELAEIQMIMGLILILSILGISFVAWTVGTGIAKSLQLVIDRLSVSNKQVSDASVESAASATELSEAATEQAASLQETMASIEEISAMVNQNAESANKAKSTVDLNAKSSEEGKQNVQRMIQAINEIKGTNDEILQQMESSNREFAAIVKIISDIGEKTKVINDIVFQTKLLSFNASVEAARAGEHGKGFAVVAEEVGNLAQMSGNAAREITDMLSGSIKKVNDIVQETTAKVDQLVEVGKDKISMGQSTADKCREALDTITDGAVTVSSMVAEIANASKEQAQGVQEINKAISQLDQVTQQNSAVAQQSSAQAENLSAEAQSLSDAVVSLVGFVQGSDSNLVGGGAPARAKAAKSETKKPSTTAKSSLAGDKVVSMHEHKSKVEKKKAISEQERSLRAKVTKKAAGSDSVPSNNDPGFEEF